jgi:NAD(P)-dependent dehydrogenase (short-subunit alcohol dehydrogenase family)
MGNLDFSGQVAVITGAGRGLGRAYAELLVARGAAVVVNDIGAPSLDGRGGDETIAEDTARMLRAAGGHAVSSCDDVATPEGGAGIVETALREFGRIDILVHNAGMIRSVPFADLSLDDFHAVMNVHVGGAVHVGRPAWKHMMERGYGRVVLTTSGGIFGMAGGVPYSTAKAALIGMARSLKHEAEAAAGDIRVNVVGPLADTRMGGPSEPIFRELADSSMVAAVVAYLVSRECQLNGVVLQAGGSHFARLFIGQTRGWAKGTPDLTPEEVMDHIAEALEMNDFSTPDNILEQIRAIGAVALKRPEVVDERFNEWVASLSTAADNQ